MKLNIEELAKQAGMDEATARVNALSPAVQAFTKAVVERCAQEAAEAENNRESASMVIRNLMEE